MTYRFNIGKNWSVREIKSRAYVPLIPRPLKLKSHVCSSVAHCPQQVYPSDIRNCAVLKQLPDDHWYIVRRKP